MNRVVTEGMKTIWKNGVMKVVENLHVMKKYIINIGFGIFVVLFGILSLTKGSNNFGNISGVVIGKGGKFSVPSRRSTEVYYDYILAIHPDDSSLKDFDSKVSLCTFVKFNVGDRIILEKQNIPDKSKEYGFSELISDPSFLIPLGVSCIIAGIIILIFTFWGTSLRDENEW